MSNDTDKMPQPPTPFPTDLTPGLSVIHGNRMEDLREVAVAWICGHPLGPLENECFVVQSNGMAQWLKLAMAADDGCGVSAAGDFQLPGRFVWNAYRAVLGNASVPDESPFAKDRLTWRLMRLLPTLTEDRRFVPLARFLASDVDQRKRHQLAVRLADLFDQYQVYRADWLEDWSRGKDRLRTAGGRFAEIPPAQAWQPVLWRRLRQSMEPSLRSAGRAALHRRFLRAVDGTMEHPGDLPRRVVVFGMSSLPSQVLETLAALSRCCQILVFVLNPCRYYWADIIEGRELLHFRRARHRPKAAMKDGDDPLHVRTHPLLASWGKQGRDYIGLLYGYDQPETYRERFSRIDLFRDVGAAGGDATLLEQVQQAVLDLEPPPASPGGRLAVAAKDRSIRFEPAHSPQREVEILQDRLLSFFETLPGLRPRDIVVMAPDIDIYAPHIEAVFGNLPADDARHIPFAIADRPERSGASLARALEFLLHLPESRLAVSEILDLLQMPAVRGRFGIAGSQLPRLHQWMAGAGIRWGLDAAHRSRFDLPRGMAQNTWQFGLKRMLLGYAVGDGSPWQGIEPYDEVGGLEADAAGRLARLVEQIEKYRRSLDRPASAARWVGRMQRMVRDFLAPETHRDRLVLNRFYEVLHQWRSACEAARLQEPLSLPVVRSALLEALTAAGVSQRFLAGAVNFGTLMPMRAIPFRVVCLLGMNDGEYPRSRPPANFDLMSGPGQYRPGDRSRREDDRYLFLEALLSAREIFYISYLGRSVRDDAVRTPSVLVSQLRDYIGAGWTVRCGKGEKHAHSDALLDRITCQHPLQPFSPDYFRPGRSPSLFTYAREWRSALERAEASGKEGALPPLARKDGLHLGLFTGLLKSPAKSFFRHRLDIAFEEIEPPDLDREPFALDRLAPFVLGDRLLRAGLAAAPEARGQAVRAALARIERSGELPMGGFGQAAAADLASPICAMLGFHDTLNHRWPQEAQPREIVLTLFGTGADAVLEDWVDGLRRNENGEGVARWEFAHIPVFDNRGRVVRAAAFIGLWMRHAAACAQETALTSLMVAPDGVVALPPLDPPAARRYLEEVFALWQQGLCAPLPVSARTAIAYLGVLGTAGEGGADAELQARALAAARRAFEGDGVRSRGERGFDPYLARVFPDFQAMERSEDGEFADLAAALYAPMLTALDASRPSAAPREAP